MIRTIGAQKARLKAQVCQEIDEYYEEFSKRSEQDEFTIDQIEELMLGQQRKLKEALTVSNSELISGIETSVKKMP